MKFSQRPCTIVQGLWSDFGATLKIHKKSNFDRNQLKLSTQYKFMYTYQCFKAESAQHGVGWSGFGYLFLVTEKAQMHVGEAIVEIYV